MRWGGVISINATSAYATDLRLEVGSQTGDNTQTIDRSSLTLENLNAQEGGAVRVWRGSTFKDSDSNYLSNSAEYGGGAIFNGNATNPQFQPSQTHVSSASFTANKAAFRGGAVFNDFGSSFKASDSSFTRNSAGDLGGAIFNFQGGKGLFVATEQSGQDYSTALQEAVETTAQLIGKNVFTQNYASGAGAIANLSVLKDNENATTEFVGNHADSWRGGAIANIGNFYDQNNSEYPKEVVGNVIARFTGWVKFDQNYASQGNGGAIANYSWAAPLENTKTQFFLEGKSEFTGNSGLNGGAIANEDGEFYLTGIQSFTDNNASGCGGAIYNASGFGKEGTYLVISGTTTFENNHAENGGAIFNGFAAAEIDSAYFRGNKADISGGAIQNGGRLHKDWLIGTLRVKNSTFENNSADYTSDYSVGGGAVMNFTNSSFVSTNNTYKNNSAKDSGGAIHNRQGSKSLVVLEGKNVFEGNEAFKSGGAIFNHAELRDAGPDSYTEFTNNKAIGGNGYTAHGGAVMNVGGLLNVENLPETSLDLKTTASFLGTVVFNGNSSGGSGGAYMNLAYPVAVQVGTGEVIHTYPSRVETTFSGNVSFKDNSSKTNGGAFFNQDALVSFSGSNTFFENNQSKIGGALNNYQKESLMTALAEFKGGNVIFEGNSASLVGGAVYNNGTIVFNSMNHVFRENTASGTGGGAIYNQRTGVISFGGNTFFENNKAGEKPNDILNDGLISFGTNGVEHQLTVIASGIDGRGHLELNSGRFIVGAGAQVHQASYTAKAGTVTTITVSQVHHVHDQNVAHFDELTDKSGTGHDKVAATIGNGGFGIHTTGQMTLEKGAVLNIVSDDIQTGHTYLVAYNEVAPEPQLAKMARAADTSVVINPAGFEHDETSWKGDNLISSNPLVKLERVEGDNTNGYILVTSKDSNSVNIIQDLAGLDQVYFSWLSDLEDLRQRLGEVRLGADNGIWTKVSYARYRASGLGDGKVKSTDYSIHVGADGTLYKNNGHKFFAGFSFKGGHTDMKAARAAGTGDLNHYTWKLYGTYVHEKGSYADVVASVGTFNNRFRGYHDSWAGQVRGDVNNWGAGISGEVGHQFRFLEEPAGSFWFAEPQIQLSYFRVKGKNYETSNNIHVEQKSVNFLTGRVGVSAGKQFAYGADKKRYLQLSAKAGLIHEFAGDQKLRLNEKKLSADGKKNLFYYGADMDWQFADNHKLYLKVDRATGNGYRKDIQIQGGYRYSF